MNDAEILKALRKELNLKQGAFASEISTTQGHISDIENGRKPLSSRTKKLICLKTWNGRYINENFLDTGNGKIFLDLPPEDEVAAAVSNILEDIGCENTIYTLLKSALLKYEQLDANSKRVLESYVDDVIVDLHEKHEKREEN